MTDPPPDLKTAARRLWDAFGAVNQQCPYHSDMPCIHRHMAEIEAALTAEDNRGKAEETQAPTKRAMALLGPERAGKTFYPSSP